MKKIIVVTACVLFAALSHGAIIPAGSHEFILEIATDFEGNDGNDSIPVMAGVGYFFDDNMEGGLYVSMRKTDWESYWGEDTAWGLGVFGQLDVFTDSVFVPFISGRIGILDGNEDDDTALNIAVGGGLRVYLTKRFCVTAQLEFDWASDEVFDFERISSTEGSGDKWDLVGRAGVRYLF